MEKILVVEFEGENASISFSAPLHFAGLKQEILSKMLEVMIQAFAMLIPPQGVEKIIVYQTQNMNLKVKVEGNTPYREKWEIAGYVMGVSLLTAQAFEGMYPETIKGGFQ